MKYLASALKQVLEQNKELVDNSQRLHDQLTVVINRITDAVTVTNRQAAINTGEGIGPLQEYEGVISELDKENGNCKLTVGSSARVNGVISDPALALPGNAYIESFVRDQLIKVTAKAQIDKDGNITKLFISDGVLSTKEV